MSEENKAITRRWIEEGLNKRALDVADKTFANDYVWHNTSIRGVEGVKRNFSAIFASFPDAHWTIEHQIAEGDMVATHGTFRGTQRGEYAGIPPTGKEVTSRWIGIERYAEGKVVEMWELEDSLGLFRQLGMFPLDSPGLVSDWGCN